MIGPNIQPIDFHVLVKLKPLEKKTDGGIIIPDTRHDRDQQAVTEATLVRSGGNAFRDNGVAWSGPVPEPGDKILVRKYAGESPTSDLDNPYRIMTDKEIVGILEAENG